jgi:preprotein translocase subunit SecF
MGQGDERMSPTRSKALVPMTAFSLVMSILLSMFVYLLMRFETDVYEAGVISFWVAYVFSAISLIASLYSVNWLFSFLDDERSMKS